MVEAVLSYLWAATLASLIQIGVFLVPGLVLALIMNYQSEFVVRHALLTMGYRPYLVLFGWLGTIVHELGHVIFCIIFRHKIISMKLFSPDRETGILGYVEQTYDSKSVYQLIGNFFIGVGPIILGTAIICLLSYLLLGLDPFVLADKFNMASSYIPSWGALLQIFQILWTSSTSMLFELFSWHNLSSWQLYLFIYLAFAIGSSITLSPSDIKASLKGSGVILILILIFNLATLWAGDLVSDIITGTIGYFRVFYIAMFLILLLNIAVSVLILLPLSLLRARHSSFRY